MNLQLKFEKKIAYKDIGSESIQVIKSKAHEFSISILLGSSTMPGMELMSNKYLVTYELGLCLCLEV